MKTSSILLFVLAILSVSCSSEVKNQKLYIGKYNSEKENGFQICIFSPKDSAISLISDWNAGPNPSYFCISEEKGLIYAANEVMNFKGGKGGGVTTLKFNENKDSLSKVNELLIPKASPCFISLSPEKKHLFLANYTGGSITVLSLNEEGIPSGISDSISFPKIDRKISHPHMMVADPLRKLVYLSDLGLDRILIYNFDEETGKLSPLKNGIVRVPEGCGPRHFVFNKDVSRMYVINELNSTISVFSIDVKGELTIIQNIPTVRKGFKGQNACADIHISENGKFLYGSNRGENTIVTFSINKNGLLKAIEHTSCGGDWPRNFTLDESGRYLLVGNQKSGNIAVLEIDKKTGIPSPTTIEYKTGGPSCLKF